MRGIRPTKSVDKFSAKKLWTVCKQYGTVVDAFIPDRRSKAGKRFDFVRFIKIFDVDRLVNPAYLRKPTVTDVEKLYLHHEEKHGFPGMLGSLDSVASQDLWIWHAFFGVAGSNNDINVLYQSPLFNDLKTGRAPEIPFVANGVTYPSGYYLVDGIYPELAPLVKTIPEPADDDHKRILYKQK
ncbi:ALP1-like protein isoform X1 [Tanacetum coccineum]